MTQTQTTNVERLTQQIQSDPKLTKKQKQIIINAYTEAFLTLIKCNILMNPSKYYSIKISHRMKKSVAHCTTETREIVIGINYLNCCIDTHNLDDLTNTIIHEMLHNITYEKDKSKEHHGEVWTAYAKQVTSQTNYKIERLMGRAMSILFRKYNSSKSTNPKYIVSCPSCGINTYYYKRSETVRNLLNGFNMLYNCARCKDNNLTIKEVNKKK